MDYVTGDTHLPIDISKLNRKRFPEQKQLTKDDNVIICGDFGLVWSNEQDKSEKYWEKWLNSKRFTTLFVDGNHENHYKLCSGVIAPDVVDSDGNYVHESGYAIEKKFGGYVGKISDSIYHLRRGEIYTINGKKYFVMGGAYSVDKANRTEGSTWWREEQANNREFYYGLDNLVANGNKVDYILGHTAPLSIVSNYFNLYGKYDSTTQYFDSVIESVEFEKFYCGHWHEDIEHGKYRFLYQDVVPV